MYADIVVLTYQSPEIDSYTYKIPKNLDNEAKVGQLVQVPFGKRSPIGIIISTNYSSSSLSLKTHQSLNDLSLRAEGQLPTTNYQIKPISSVILPQPILLPYQIKLLKWMSFYYIAPMVNCLEAMLPVAALNAKRLTTNVKTNYQLPVSTRSIRGGPTTNYQTVILVPTINKIPETLAKFPKARNYAVYHNELKKSEKIATWFKILSGKVDYIFGSRSAIFAPCPNLAEIIIYDEHDKAYKDERSPYFDILTIAQKISQFTTCKLQIIDSSPKITTYFQRDVHPGGGQKKVKVKIISMQDERLAQNFSPISTFLEDQLKKNKNSLLFLNKKKESGSLFCKNCKFNDYFEKQPEMCPKCKSPEIYFNVLNVNKLKDEVSKYYTNQLPTINYKLPDIATASIFYSLVATKYDLIAYIQPDSLLNRTDFSSVETLYFQIANLKKILREDGILVIQTYNPDDETLRMVAYSNYPLFFKDQLEKRKLLSYPPFALLVKLIIKGPTYEKVEKLAHQIFNYLSSKLQTTNYKLQTNLLGPFTPLFFFRKPTFNIIIKYRLKNYDLKLREGAIKNLSPILKDFNKKAQIVVEPESIN